MRCYITERHKKKKIYNIILVKLSLAYVLLCKNNNLKAFDSFYLCSPFVHIVNSLFSIFYP